MCLLGGIGIEFIQVVLLTQFVIVTPTFVPVSSSTAFTTPITSTTSIANNNHHNHIQTRSSSKAIRKPNIHQYHAVKKKKYNQNLGTFERLDLKPKTKGGEQQQYDGEYDGRIAKLYDFSMSDSIKYQLMWDIQKDILEGHVQRLKVEFEKKKPASQFWSIKEILDTTIDNDEKQLMIDISDRTRGCDSIIMLQHEPVYTLGTASDENFIKSIDDDIDVVRIERGGEVTYHGPGQLTVYPIIDLRGYKQDIHWYMRALEEAILLSLQKVGISGAMREDDVTGVWVDGKKIAALGVKIRRWVSMHGIAINVDQRSLENFNGIVPCGLEGRKVCCVNDFLESPISVDEFAKHLKDALEDIFEIKIL